MMASMLVRPRQSGPLLSRYLGWSPGWYGLRGGRVTVMFRFSAGSPSAPKAWLIIGLNRVRPLSRHGYSGEYLAKTPRTGRDVWASEMRFCSLVSRKPAVTFDEASTTVKVRRSCSDWSTRVLFVIDRLSRTA